MVTCEQILLRTVCTISLFEFLHFFFHIHHMSVSIPPLLLLFFWYIISLYCLLAVVAPSPSFVGCFQHRYCASTPVPLELPIYPGLQPEGRSFAEKHGGLGWQLHLMWNSNKACVNHVIGSHSACFLLSPGCDAGMVHAGRLPLQSQMPYVPPACHCGCCCDPRLNNHGGKDHFVVVHKSRIDPLRVSMPFFLGGG